MIFFINHLSLIIFHYSVWQGFERFEALGPCAWSFGAVLHPRAKDMIMTICHNKPPDRKWTWSVDDVIPRGDGPENLRILKRRHLRFCR